MTTICHTADLHFSTNTELLVEVVRTSNFMLERFTEERPAAIVIAGDLLDHYIGKIPLDSVCFRSAKSFVHQAADIAPVVIIRGTKSHDRDISGLFDDIASKHPIHVASEVDMIALDTTGKFVTIDSDPYSVEVAFTLIPQLDKTYMTALDSIRSGNMAFKEAVHDLFSGFGVVNDRFTATDVPTVLVTHGMLSGAFYSSGQQAVGDDLEFGLNDLHAARTTGTMMGHVHKQQTFPGHVAYCGGSSRLNFGEQEEKGFLVWEFAGAKVADIRFVKTPARRFCLGEADTFIDDVHVYNQAKTLAAECSGCDVRFRVSVPEEDRATLDRERLEQIFLVAGANKVRLEISIIPKINIRSEGISRETSLVAKERHWAATVGQTLSPSDESLTSIVEGRSAEELLAQALLDCEPVQVILPPVPFDLHFTNQPVHGGLFA